MDWLVNEVDLPMQVEWVYPSIQNLIGNAPSSSPMTVRWITVKSQNLVSPSSNGPVPSVPREGRATG